MESMKKWVLMDAAYVRKMQEEITICTKSKLEIIALIKNLEYERAR